MGAAFRCSRSCSPRAAFSIAPIASTARARTREMPKKYWRNMPETSLVQPLIAPSRTRELEMIDRTVGKRGTERCARSGAGNRAGGNLRPSWEALFEEARHARVVTSTRCILRLCSAKARSTQGSCSSASSQATRRTSPGAPSWDLPVSCSTRRSRRRGSTVRGLRHQCRQAFQFVQRGKRRIHNKPDGSEIAACRWWIEHERALISPAVTVALGATAARRWSIRSVTICGPRGRPLPLADGSEVLGHHHPSLLRASDEEDRKARGNEAVPPRLEAHPCASGRADELPHQNGSRRSP